MENPIINIAPLSEQWSTPNPCLFCAHHKDTYPKGTNNFGPEDIKGRNIGQDFTPKDGWRMYHGTHVPGFPVHPHRGFETITYAATGFVDHSDSLGNAGRFGNGDVQWMTAGKGIQHAEMFPLLHQDKENTLELFQIWLNLPASSKMVAPYYKMIWNENLAKLKEPGVEIIAIAGSYKGASGPQPPIDSWANNPENDVAVWIITLEPNTKWQLPAAQPTSNRALYFYNGSGLQVEHQNIPDYNKIELKPHVPISLQSGKTTASILLLQGKPIHEPIAQYGPFVMNTQRELMETIDDYNRTRFGGWPWPSNEPIHNTGTERFSKNKLGEIEKPTRI